MNTKEQKMQTVMDLANRIRGQFPDQPGLDITCCPTHQDIKLGFNNDCSTCLLDGLGEIVGYGAALNFYIAVKVQQKLLAEMCANISESSNFYDQSDAEQ